MHTSKRTSLCLCSDELAAQRLIDGPPSCSTLAAYSLALWYGPTNSSEGCCCQSSSKVNYSTTLCQITTSEIDAAHQTAQKLQGIQNIPSQRVTDLEAAIRQLRQISCILDSCTISASYEVSQAQKAILLLDHTAKGASTSSEELNAQISPRTDDEHNFPYHEDDLQEY